MLRFCEEEFLLRIFGPVESKITQKSKGNILHPILQFVTYDGILISNSCCHFVTTKDNKSTKTSKLQNKTFEPITLHKNTKCYLQVNLSSFHSLSSCISIYCTRVYIKKSLSLQSTVVHEITTYFKYTVVFAGSSENRRFFPVSLTN